MFDVTFLRHWTIWGKAQLQSSIVICQLMKERTQTVSKRLPTVLSCSEIIRNLKLRNSRRMETVMSFAFHCHSFFNDKNSCFEFRCPNSGFLCRWKYLREQDGKLWLLCRWLCTLVAKHIEFCFFEWMKPGFLLEYQTLPRCTLKTKR